MPNPRGAVLTDRDRALLAYVAIARYASAEQVHRLFFDGSSRKQTYRRLAKLCTPGGKLGQDACLRRLQFRRRDGTAVPVWALTGYGRGLAEEKVSYLRAPAASDVGHRFLEHTLLLNDVLAGLVAALRHAKACTVARTEARW
jgi:Replication-relaxation